MGFKSIISRHKSRPSDQELSKSYETQFHVTTVGIVRIELSLTFFSSILALEHLVASRTRLTDAGLTGLLRRLPRLLHLDVEGCADLTSESISTLPKFCKSLRSLNVSFSLKVKASAVLEVEEQLSSLHRVEMRGLHIAECLDD